MAKISELADGGNLLNDDELIVLRAGGNVRATVANLPEVDASGNMSFADNEKATFGTGSDLQIYHDGSHSYVSDVGTGHLRLTGTNVLVEDGVGTDYIYCASDVVNLYHGGNLKFKTTSTGIDVTGTATMDGLTLGNAQYVKLSDTTTDSPRVLGMNSANTTYVGPIDSYDGGGIIYGASSNVNAQSFLTSGNKRLVIGSGGDISFYEDTGSTPKFYWDASAEALGIGTTTPNYLLDIEGSGALFRINATSGDATAQLSVADTTSLNTINFGDSGSTTAGQILYRHNGDSMAFNVGGAEAVRILDGGNVGIGTSSPSTPLHIQGSDTASSEQLLSLVNGGGAADAGARLWLSGTNATTRGTYIEGQARSTGNNHDLIFATSAVSAAPTERMRIDFNGNVGIGTSSPATQLEVSNAASAVLRLSTSDTSVDDNQELGALEYSQADASGAGAGVKASIRAKADNSTAAQTYLAFHTSDSSTNDVERVRIDNAGNVGIGNTAPSTFNTSNAAGNLVVGSGSGSEGITIYTGTTSNGALCFADGTTSTDTYKGYIQYNHSTDSMQFATGHTEAMRIDSSGNLLVGTTDNTLYNNGAGGETGICLRPNLSLDVTRSSGATLNLNRLDSDGEIIDFRRDGTTVGSIGSNGGDLFVGTGDTNILFADGSDKIMPATTGGATRDAAIDLGTTGGRFKDLYLSGGAYLGGTAAANKLDDYEEGTFTPELSMSTSGTMTATVASANYTKIGRLVHFQIYFTNIDNTSPTPSGDLTMTGLPFASIGTSGFTAINLSHNTMMTNATTTPYGGYVNSGNTTIAFTQGNASSVSDSLLVASTGRYLMISGCYQTTA